MRTTETRLDQLGRRLRLQLFVSVVFLACSVALLVFSLRSPRTEVDMDAVNRLLYAIYAEEHPRPAGLSGTAEVDRYDAAYANWRYRVVGAFLQRR
jgi:hypothetical protein